MKKILILTASFGDGHNAAARNLRDALELITAKTRSWEKAEKLVRKLEKSEKTAILPFRSSHLPAFAVHLPLAIQD